MYDVPDRRLILSWELCITRKIISKVRSGDRKKVKRLVLVEERLYGGKCVEPI